MLWKKTFILTSLALCSAAVFAQNFVIADLTKGKEVTLPKATVAIAHGTERTTLTPTNMPQTLKFSIDPKQGNVPMTIIIYDSNAERPLERRIDPSAGLLYPVASLRSIAVVGKSPRMLRIESDRPYTVAH